MRVLFYTAVAIAACISNATRLESSSGQVQGSTTHNLSQIYASDSLAQEQQTEEECSTCESWNLAQLQEGEGSKPPVKTDAAKAAPPTKDSPKDGKKPAEAGLKDGKKPGEAPDASKTDAPAPIVEEKKPKQKQGGVMPTETPVKVGVLQPQEKPVKLPKGKSDLDIDIEPSNPPRLPSKFLKPGTTAQDDPEPEAGPDPNSAAGIKKGLEEMDEALKKASIKKPLAAEQHEDKKRIFPRTETEKPELPSRLQTVVDKINIDALAKKEERAMDLKSGKEGRADKTAKQADDAKQIAQKITQSDEHPKELKDSAKLHAISSTVQATKAQQDILAETDSNLAEDKKEKEMPDLTANPGSSLKIVTPSTLGKIRDNTEKYNEQKKVALANNNHEIQESDSLAIRLIKKQRQEKAEQVKIAEAKEQKKRDDEQKRKDEEERLAKLKKAEADAKKKMQEKKEAKVKELARQAEADKRRKEREQKAAVDQVTSSFKESQEAIRNRQKAASAQTEAIIKQQGEQIEQLKAATKRISRDLQSVEKKALKELDPQKVIQIKQETIKEAKSIALTEAKTKTELALKAKEGTDQTVDKLQDAVDDKQAEVDALEKKQADEKDKAKALIVLKKATDQLAKANDQAEIKDKSLAKAQEEQVMREEALKSNEPPKPIVAPSTEAESKEEKKPDPTVAAKKEEKPAEKETKAEQGDSEKKEGSDKSGNASPTEKAETPSEKAKLE